MEILDIHNNFIEDLDPNELPPGLIEINMIGNPYSKTLAAEDPHPDDLYVRYKIIDKIKANCPKLTRFNNKIVGNL